MLVTGTFVYSTLLSLKIFTSLFDFTVSQNIDVLALTETWLCCGDNAVLNELLAVLLPVREISCN